MFLQNLLIGLLILLVGAAFCFVGYRFFQVLIAVWGFIAGFNLGAAGMTALFGQTFLGTTAGWILGLVVGLVFAVLSYLFYYFAVVILGASAGYALGSGLMAAFGLSNPGFLSVTVGIVFAVVFTLLIVFLNLPKLLIILYTAFSGAVAMLTGFLVILGRVPVVSMQYGIAVALVRAWWFWGLLAIALTVVGFLIQWRTTQVYSLTWSEAKIPGEPSNV